MTGGKIGKIVRWVVTAIVIVGMVLFARTVNWHDTWKAIRSASPGILLVATLVNLASLAIKGVRWWIFLRPVGAPSLPLAMRATFAGAGLNNVLVANGGEAARVIFVSRASHVPSARVLATLALERLFELMGYVVMLALAVSFLNLPASIERFRPVAWLSLAVVLGLLVYLVRRPEKAARVVVEGAGWKARFGAYMSRFMETMAELSTPSRFVAALLLSVGVWILQVVTYHMTARAAGFPITLVGTVACLLAVNLGFALRATPGNVGVFQMLYAVTAVAMGLDRNQAIAVAFLIQTQQILPVTILGVAMAPEFLLKRGKTRPIGEREAAIEESKVVRGVE
ncbi:MAG: hypothetical protein JWO05_3156 [Gemmatimonadetes bacterium]|nr:hypothetical protein [Gemmatimonadota bacterium]